MSVNYVSYGDIKKIAQKINEIKQKKIPVSGTKGELQLADGEIGIALEDGIFYRNGDKLVPVSGKGNEIDLSVYYTKEETDGKIGELSESGRELSQGLETLKENLSSEALNRTEADNTLGKRIDDMNASVESFAVQAEEALTELEQVRKDADKLSENVEKIEEKIPSAASKDNQLADKNFVLQHVATNTANFRGEWPDWASVPSDGGRYPADYSGNHNPTENDYMVVRDMSDYDPSYRPDNTTTTAGQGSRATASLQSSGSPFPDYSLWTVINTDRGTSQVDVWVSTVLSKTLYWYVDVLPSAPSSQSSTSTKKVSIALEPSKKHTVVVMLPSSGWSSSLNSLYYQETYVDGTWYDQKIGWYAKPWQGIDISKFNGSNVWESPNTGNIYYLDGDNGIWLQLMNGRWIEKAWSGIDDRDLRYLSASNIWHHGEDIYLSAYAGMEQYRLSSEKTGTWVPIDIGDKQWPSWGNNVFKVGQYTYATMQEKGRSTKHTYGFQNGEWVLANVSGMDATISPESIWEYDGAVYSNSYSADGYKLTAVSATQINAEPVSWEVPPEGLLLGCEIWHDKDGDVYFSYFGVMQYKLNKAFNRWENVSWDESIFFGESIWHDAEGNVYYNTNDELADSGVPNASFQLMSYSPESYYKGAWQFKYTGDWTSNGKDGWEPQFALGDAVDLEMLDERYQTIDKAAEQGRRIDDLEQAVQMLMSAIASQ